MRIILLYIDPGTGSMLFTILLGISSALYFAIKLSFIKFKHKLLGGKIKLSDDKIPFVIFAESKTYFNVFNPICRELDTFGKKILYITGSSDDPMLNNEYINVDVEVIENQNKLFAKLNLIKANILLSTTPGLDIHQWKKSKDVDYYVHIMHAANEIVTYKMFGIDYYDVILLSGKYQEKDVRDLEKIRNLPKKELEIVGIPYLDELKRRKDATVKDIKNKNGEINVLLAPTWGDLGILSKYGSKMIDALIATGYNITIRPHPQSFISEKKLIEGFINKYENCSKVKWNKDRDNFDVLNSADVMISDYSGVVFDYALVFNKPIIYTNPRLNYDKRDACWLKRPIWTESALPRLGIELTDERLLKMKETIDYVLHNDDFEKGRNEVKSEVWQKEGEGAINVKNFLVEKYVKLSTSVNFPCGS